VLGVFGVGVFNNRIHGFPKALHCIADIILGLHLKVRFVI